MALAGRLAGNRTLTLLAQTTIAGAVTGVTTTPVTELSGMGVLTVQFTFLYGANGTSVQAWIQTSFDGGTTWVDVIAFAAATTAITRISSVRATTAVAANYTPTDGALTDNTIKDGLLGDRVRVKYTTVGTYSGATSLAIHAVAKGH